MNNFIVIPAAVAVLIGAVVYPTFNQIKVIAKRATPEYVAREEARRARVLTATPPDPDEVVPPAVRVQAAIYAALDSKQPDRAEAILKEHLGDVSFCMNPQMHELGVELLAGHGAKTDAAALTETLGLLHGRFGPWMPDARKLRPALMAAIRLKAVREADELATAIIAKRDWSFSNYVSLNAPTSGQTLDHRLAYALLSLAHEANWDNDRDLQVQCAEKAREFLPNDVPVMVQLAAAYRDRNKEGDRSRAADLLKRAYRLLPAASSVRRDVRLFASDVVDVAPESKTSLQEDLRSYALAEHKAQVERMEAARRRAQLGK